MALIPKNTNPLLDYLNGGNPANTIDGLVVDGVYGVTGVINTIGSSTQSYQDPVTGQISNVNVLSIPYTPTPTQWISAIVDDEMNTTYELNFNFNRNTFINFVSFNLLQVPCTWALYQGSISPANQISTGIISAYNTTNYQYISVKFPSTYEFTTTTSLVLVLTKSTTGTQYNLGVAGFVARLIVESYSDLEINSTTVSGITAQNNLGFVETYSPVTYPVANLVPDSDEEEYYKEYWKCAPQPTGDSIVWFVVDLGSLQVINKMFLDPLYSSSVFNLYYSYDNEFWYPVQRDFNLKKGIYDLPTILTRYLKFEFTQLIPEPYNLPFDSIQRTINVFPDWVDNYYTNIERAIPDVTNQTYSLSSAIVPNVSYNQQLSSYTTYGAGITNLDGISYGTANSANTVNNSNNNTTITDPTVSYKTLADVAGIGSSYSPVSDVAFITRRFPYATTHTYKQITLNQTWHEAYFTGLKELYFYCTDQSIQSDYYEFTDYFLTNSSNTTIVSGTGTTAIFRNPEPFPVVVSGVTYTIVSGGGYRGAAGNQLLTQNLKTYTTFNSFKMASLSSDWVPYLSNNQTLLLGSLSTLGVTTSGVSNKNLTPVNSNYGLYSFTPSGSNPSIPPIQTYVNTPIAAGGYNLLTTAESALISGTGWNGPISATTRITTGTISGVTNVTVPLLTNTQNSYGHGEDVYGNETFGTPTSIGIANPNNYTFLVTASGSGTISTYVTYSGVGVSIISGTSFNINGSSDLNFFTTQPLGTTVASVVIAASGGASFQLSQAGFFLGHQTGWSTPIVTSGLRMSATARVYLPNSNMGTYRCGLYSNDVELAHNQFSNIPLRTWVDIEVPFTLVSGYYNNNNFSARLTQTNGNGEVYECAMLGVFYNPVTWEYCTDGTGSVWNWVTTGINDPSAMINLRAPTNQVQFRGTLIQDGSQISALTVLPNYTQNPYYTTTPINYIGDPKTNELSWRRTPAQRPLFQLHSELHPAAYDIGLLMNIQNPYSLD